jgi:hypothetical protein
MDKLDYSEGVPSDGSPSAIFDANYLRTSVNHAEFYEGTNSSEVNRLQCNVCSCAMGEESSSVGELKHLWSSHTDPFAKGMQCNEQASYLQIKCMFYFLP